jgi:thioredoxin reductase
LADGRALTARRLLVTAGLVDELPDIPGLRERWGRDVLHCPYCHGWEVRDQRIGVLANGPRSVHQALLFRQLSDDVTYFTNTTSLASHEVEQLEARSVAVVETAIDSLSVHDDHLRGVRLDDGTEINLDAFAVMPRMVARATFLAGLGLEAVPHPSGTGDHIPVDATGRTSVPGVWAAGNVTDIAAQVGASAAGGAFAAQQINADLVGEDTSAAVARRRCQA